MKCMIFNFLFLLSIHGLRISKNAFHNSLIHERQNSRGILMSSYQPRREWSGSGPQGGGSRGGYQGGGYQSGGGGGGYRGGGGRGRFGDRSRQQQQQDPFAKLRFKTNVKIDPDAKTPLAEMKFSERTRKTLEGKGFFEMTPVQSQSYDYVYAGGDVVARSKTGTGKTFAFGLPLIEKMVESGDCEKRGKDLPLVLILEPTRELAIQVAQELGSVCAAHRMRVLAVYGGSSFSAQGSKACLIVCEVYKIEFGVQNRRFVKVFTSLWQLLEGH